MSNKEKVRKFLKTQLYMTIATSYNDVPEAAVVGFGEMHNFDLIFGTNTTTRKFQNIQNNSRVAIVFTNYKDTTVQYEGIVSVLIGDELGKYKKTYFTKNPPVKEFENLPNQIYLKVMPIWIRYTHFSDNENEIFEINLA